MCIVYGLRDDSHDLKTGDVHISCWPWNPGQTLKNSGKLLSIKLYAHSKNNHGRSRKTKINFKAMILTLPSHHCVLTLLKLSIFALDNISTDNPSCGPIFSFHSNFCEISRSRVKCCLCLHFTPVILLFFHFDVGCLYLLHVPTSKFVLLQHVLYSCTCTIYSTVHDVS